MEGHLLKTDRLVRSERWEKMEDDFTRLVYCLLVGTVDSWGMMPADGFTLKARLDPNGMTPVESYPRAVDSLTRVGLVYTWEHQGRPWLYIVGHDEQQKRGISKRKKHPDVPRPDDCDTYPQPVAPKPQPVAGKAHSEGETEVEVEGEREGSPPSPPTSIPSIQTLGKTIGRVIDPASGTFTTSPSLMPRSEPPTAQRVIMDHGVEATLNELRQHHARIGGYEARGFVRLDEHAERIAKVLAEYDQAGCEQIQRGHLAKSDQAGGKYRAWPNAYPAVEGDKCEPNWDWIAEYHSAGKVAKPADASGWTPGSQPFDDTLVECPGCRTSRPLAERGADCVSCGVHIGEGAREGTSLGLTKARMAEEAEGRAAEKLRLEREAGANAHPPEAAERSEG